MRALTQRQVLLSALIILAVLATIWGFGGVAQGATLTVNKTADTEDGVCDADCSLREAIIAASSGDTVSIPAGIYTLTLGFELTINKDLTLSGSGAGSTIIQAATSPGVANFRVLNISEGNVDISGVTIHYGDADSGGGISNRGTLTLTGTTVSGNVVGFYGGGIINPGTLTLIYS